jgi:hypothetical protein
MQASTNVDGEIRLRIAAMFASPEMSRIKEWVLLNRDVLLDYWLEKTSTEGMMARIRRLA